MTSCGFGRAELGLALPDRATPLDEDAAAGMVLMTQWHRLAPHGDGTLTDAKPRSAGAPWLGVAPTDLGMRVLVGDLVGW
jgi:hypothetical protein